jgi:hypothetical protein
LVAPLARRSSEAGFQPRSRWIVLAPPHNIIVTGSKGFRAELTLSPRGPVNCAVAKQNTPHDDFCVKAPVLSQNAYLTQRRDSPIAPISVKLSKFIQRGFTPIEDLRCLDRFEWKSIPTGPAPCIPRFA